MWPFSQSANFTAIVTAKRDARARALESAPTFVASEHEQYIKATAVEIVKKIEEGAWTAAAVLEAYIARAAVAHGTANCLTEIMFDAARLRAKQLDEDFARTKTLKGPLHGVPVSVKDLFDVVGYDSSCGFTSWTNKPSTGNADLVALLLAAGAVLLTKTNVPQTMLAFECANPLWGRTLNPYSDAHTCGGSSGGEAALLAMDGAALGLGSDVGGSLRIPPSFCGVFALKPGSARVARGGMRSPWEGFDAIKTVAGPIGRSVADIELAAKLLLGAPDTLDEVAPVPWRDVELKPKLRFGYYTDDGYVKASPANKRAVLEAVAALEREGHECIEFELPFSVEPMHNFMQLIGADSYQRVRHHLGADPVDASLKLTMLGPRLYDWVRGAGAWVIETFMGDRSFARLLRDAGSSSVHDYHRWIVRRDEMAMQFKDEVWTRYGFDGIIAPVLAIPALPHGSCKELSSISNATIMYNITDTPVGVVPVTRVDPSLDALTPEWTSPPARATASTILARLIYGGAHPFYDARALAGVPVGVQVVGQKWEEEKVVQMMGVLDAALGPRSFGPGAWAAARTAALGKQKYADE